MTPAEAREPYSAVAADPFRILIDSILSGSISEAAFP